MAAPIIQFGTSRFLQAHVDLMLSEAAAAGQDVGSVTVVETTGSPASRARIAAFREGKPYPVRIRGLVDGRPIDEERQVSAISDGLSAREDIDRLAALFAGPAATVISNTGDRGYDVPVTPVPTLDGWTTFPELLTALLYHRFQAGGGGMTLFPCELVEQNGARLAALVDDVAAKGALPQAFRDWLPAQCRFVDSLVDRIVSAPIEPVGAVAEPYALWAIRAMPGVVPPCRHKDIQVVDDLDFIERRKLFVLNLGHTLLADRWLREGRRADETVREIIADPAVRDWLEGIMRGEVIPVFGERQDEIADYFAVTLDRFANPFLDHRLADIAQNHAAKIDRRAGGLVRFATSTGHFSTFPMLKATFPGIGG